MDNSLKEQIDGFALRLANKTDDLSESRIKRSDFDKTYIGWVSEEITNKDGSKKWRIQADGIAYDVDEKQCDIEKVGQRVRLYIPNHKYKDKYAEVIENDVECTEMKIKKDKLIFLYEDETSDEVKLTRDEFGRITSFEIDGKIMKVTRDD